MEQGLAPTDGPPTIEELTLASRNHAMLLEALRYDVTPPGLHYVLVHFDVPDADAGAWRLSMSGLFSSPASLTLEDIRARPAVTVPVTMECAGNGRALLSPRPLSQPWFEGAVGTARWTGTPLAPLLEEAGLDAGAVEIVFTGADRGVQGGREEAYGRSLTVADAMRPEVMLAYEMNGAPLPPQHGVPLRLLVPGWYGMTSVKWLTSIEAVAEPFEGYQQAVAYRWQRDAADPGEPIARIRPRALMIPPGIPDFFTRARSVQPGPLEVRGRAWSGLGAIERVEFGVDGTWSPATLGPVAGEHAWRAWHASWDAVPGEHVLSCRAWDAAGNAQPLDQPWNYQGMGNNLVQRVTVSVG